MGPKIGEVARRLGKPLMPWQQYVADVLGEIDPATGELVYDEWGLTVPRQSGKSTFVMAKFVHRGSATQFFGPRQQMVYTAQTRKKAREKWREDFVQQIESSPVFKTRLRAMYGSGDEHLRFPNGSRFSLEANTEKAGHGGTLDEAYLDEAFAQVDGRLEQAFRPAMITRRNTQLGWISTAGWSDGSAYLQAKVKRGRDQAQMGMREGLAYFEWSAPEDADPEDRDVWRSCMPALGYTIREQDIAAELNTHRDEGKLNDFRRAYLNLWVPRSAEESDIFGGQWAALADPDAERGSSPAFGVDLDEQRMVSIAVAWERTDGAVQVMLTDTGLSASAAPARLAELTGRWGGVVVLGGPSSALEVDLSLQVPVSCMTGVEFAQACGSLADRVREGRVRHGNQAALNSAVKGARWRSVGTAGERAWQLKDAVGVGPLAAATRALHGLSVGPSIYEDRGLVTL